MILHAKYKNKQTKKTKQKKRKSSELYRFWYSSIAGQIRRGRSLKEIHAAYWAVKYEDSFNIIEEAFFTKIVNGFKIFSINLVHFLNNISSVKIYSPSIPHWISATYQLNICKTLKQFNTFLWAIPFFNPTSVLLNYFRNWVSNVVSQRKHHVKLMTVW